MSLPACAVWWARPVDPARRPGLVELLDDHERERLARFRRPADRARYLAAHALARLVLGAHRGLPPAAVVLDRRCACGAQHGKPRVADGGGPQFSLTHSGDAVGVAVHDGPVGLDVEQVRPIGDLPAMTSHCWSPAELERGLRVDAGAFLTVWTRKESLLKATGDGLTVPMAELTVSAPTEPAALHTWAGADPMWVRDLHPGPGYLAAVAGPGTRAPEVTVHDGDAALRTR